MLIGQALILGFIQGVTEFLPISSSGHLIVVPNLFNWPDQGLGFDACVHLGTFLAVILYFRKEVGLLIYSFFIKTPESKNWRRLAVYILVATIPAAIFGLLFKVEVANILRSPSVVAASLIFWAIILYLAEIYSEKYANHNKLPRVGFWQSLAIGFWQVIALIPGTSRSGITMTGGMLVGMNKELAIKFSFLLSLPIIALAGIYSLTEMLTTGGELLNWSFVLTGFLSSLVSGYFAIAFLLKIISNWGFRPFIVYRIILALIIIFIL